MSKPLTFGELKIGAEFIMFPCDGDDSGHGGYRRPSRVFIKTTGYHDIVINSGRAISLDHGIPSAFSNLMEILLLDGEVGNLRAAAAASSEVRHAIIAALMAGAVDLAWEIAEAND